MARILIRVEIWACLLVQNGREACKIWNITVINGVGRKTHENVNHAPDDNNN